MLHIGIAPSPVLAGLLIIAHLIAGTCIVAFLPAWWAVVLATGLGASLVFHLRRDALRLSADAVIEVTLRDHGRCELLTRGGTALEGTIAGSSFVSALFTVVNVRLDGERKLRSVVVMPDCAAVEERRRLRVWLRFRAHSETPDSASL